MEPERPLRLSPPPPAPPLPSVPLNVRWWASACACQPADERLLLKPAKWPPAEPPAVIEADRGAAMPRADVRPLAPLTMLMLMF